MSLFTDSSYELLKQIPKGKITSYKDIANTLGTKAYRAIGNAMNKNPYDTGIYPCHRVIKHNGEIGGYALGVKLKILKLQEEGIEIINNKIDFNRYRFKFNTKR